jgi:hypothetical protein
VTGKITRPRKLTNCDLATMKYSTEAQAAADESDAPPEPDDLGELTPEDEAELAELESGETEPQPKRFLDPALGAAIDGFKRKVPRRSERSLADPLAEDRARVHNSLLKHGLSETDLIAAHPDFWELPRLERSRTLARFVKAAAGAKAGKVAMSARERKRKSRAKHATGRGRGRPPKGLTDDDRKRAAAARQRRRRDRLRAESRENPTA